jgi:hypothetical protein
MKTAFFAIVTLLSSMAFATPSWNECSARIDLAKQNAEHARDRYASGESTLADFSEAKLDLLDLRLACSDITRKDYCSADNLLVLNEYIIGIRAGHQIGSRSYAELRTAENRNLTMTYFCQK